MDLCLTPADWIVTVVSVVGSIALGAYLSLRMRSGDLLGLGVVDSAIEEPLGGAHQDPHKMANSLKSYLVKSLKELSKLSTDELLEARYQKFRLMGKFHDATLAESSDA